VTTPETVQSVQDRLRVKRLLLIERWVDEEIAKPPPKVIFFEDRKLTPEGAAAASEHWVNARGLEALCQLDAERERLRGSVTGVSPLHEAAKADSEQAFANRVAEVVAPMLANNAALKEVRPALRRLDALEDTAADAEALGQLMHRVSEIERHIGHACDGVPHTGIGLWPEHSLLARVTNLEESAESKVEPQAFEPKPISQCLAVDAANAWACMPAEPDFESQTLAAVWPLRRAAFIAGYEQALADMANAKPMAAKDRA
jgi:hypothetical protein